LGQGIKSDSRILMMVIVNALDKIGRFRLRLQKEKSSVISRAGALSVITVAGLVEAGFSAAGGSSE
jgi:hypothetical protein